jgi:hypothetical protein
MAKVQEPPPCATAQNTPVESRIRHHLEWNRNRRTNLRDGAVAEAANSVSSLMQANHHGS